ncbi:hypothetical protein SAB1495 [Staphylococcus aureus RF122]|nr:hypothetical protein SAB1495 [Staphylococcus aureus RF122]
MGRFQNIEKHIQNLKNFISLYLHFFLFVIRTCIFIYLIFYIFNLFIIAIFKFFYCVFSFIHKTHINRSSYI